MGVITTLSNLVNPEVMADLVDKKLVDAIKFAPLATVDTTLANRPGDTLSLPAYSYIGNASILAEASPVSTVPLTASTVTVQVHKIAVGVELSDESILAGYGDPMGEATSQIVISMGSAVDNEMLAVLASIESTMTYSTSTTTTEVAVADISAAQELFGEDIDAHAKVVVVSPQLYTLIRNTNNTWLPASEIAADKLIRGAVGEIYGCQIIVSNKLKAQTGTGNAYIVMPGALRIIMKRNCMIETDRDILKFTNVITASQHFACYLYDATKAIKITKLTA